MILITTVLEIELANIELVIFDCDGVLVDSEKITNQLLVNLLREYGIEYKLEAFVSRYVGTLLEEVINQISEEFKVAFPESFISDYYQKAYVELQQNLQEINGVRNLIERLDVPFCVASNSQETKLIMMLKKVELLHYFEGKIFSATHVKQPKPAPDLYLKAAHTFNINTENCFVIEDTPTGIRAGKAAGMTVYGYAGLFSEQALLNAGADNTFNQMDQLFTSGVHSKPKT